LPAEIKIDVLAFGFGMIKKLIQRRLRPEGGREIFFSTEKNSSELWCPGKFRRRFFEEN